MGVTLQKISLNVPHARYWESDELPMTTSIFSLQEHPRRTLLQEDVHSQCVGYENAPFFFNAGTLAVGQLAGTSPFRFCTAVTRTIGLSSRSPVIDLFRARGVLWQLICS
jgi:hypothetical protein